MNTTESTVLDMMRHTGHPLDKWLRPMDIGGPSEFVWRGLNGLIKLGLVERKPRVAASMRSFVYRLTDLGKWDPTALATLQFHWGGLFDMKSADGLIHLVRALENHGTPGPTLCGIDRFAEGGPGFSVRGGVSGPNVKTDPCPSCAKVRAQHYPDLPISGDTFKAVFS